MDTAQQPISPWPYVVSFATFLLASLAAWALLLIAPTEHVDHALDKIGAGIAIVLDDPAGFATSVIGLLTAGAAIYSGAKALLHTTPRARG